MVLDSKVLLILLRGESKHERVSRALEQPCVITTVSLACLLAELSSVSPRALIEDLDRLGVASVPVDSSLAVEAAKLASLGASSETLFALALARQRGLDVMFSKHEVAVPPGWSLKINVIG